MSIRQAQKSECIVYHQHHPDVCGIQKRNVYRRRSKYVSGPPIFEDRSCDKPNVIDRSRSSLIYKAESMRCSRHRSSDSFHRISTSSGYSSERSPLSTRTKTCRLRTKGQSSWRENLRSSYRRFLAALPKMFVCGSSEACCNENVDDGHIAWWTRQSATQSLKKQASCRRRRHSVEAKQSIVHSSSEENEKICVAGQMPSDERKPQKVKNTVSPYQNYSPHSNEIPSETKKIPRLPSTRRVVIERRTSMYAGAKFNQASKLKRDIYRKKLAEMVRERNRFVNKCNVTELDVLCDLEVNSYFYPSEVTDLEAFRQASYCWNNDATQSRRSRNPSIRSTMC
ncbi:hypothetical protein ACOME3_002617 [Neoechinorhynchus agilis]